MKPGLPGKGSTTFLIAALWLAWSTAADATTPLCRPNVVNLPFADCGGPSVTVRVAGDRLVNMVDGDRLISVSVDFRFTLIPAKPGDIRDMRFEFVRVRRGAGRTVVLEYRAVLNGESFGGDAVFRSSGILGADPASPNMNGIRGQLRQIYLCRAFGNTIECAPIEARN